VAELIHITDTADPRLADYLHLRETTLRKGFEAREGIFIAEGELVIRRALASGYKPRSLLLAPKWLAGLQPLVAGLDVPVYVMPPSMAEAVTGFHVHRGALAAMIRRPEAPLADLLVTHRLVVCEDIVDHANLGAIIRSAAGLGWDGVLVSPGSADPLYRRAVKASMGTVFAVPCRRLAAWPQAITLLRDAGFAVAALALADGAMSLDEAARRLAPAEKLAVVLGSEGPGLRASTLDACDFIVRIPMARGVDSLNVAVAAGLACYALRRPVSPQGLSPRPSSQSRSPESLSSRGVSAQSLEPG